MTKKEPWNECNPRCRVITDPDEKKCPACGNTHLKLIELDENEVKARIREGKFWTKWPARWWSK